MYLHVDDNLHPPTPVYDQNGVTSWRYPDLNDLDKDNCATQYYPVVPPGTDIKNSSFPDGIPLCLQNFLQHNPRTSRLKTARDTYLGWKRYLSIAIFAFLLFFPMLGMITRLKTYAWVICFLWIVLIVLLVFYYEYRCRAELWYICIYRGIILDFKKTQELKKWALHPVMFIAYFFIILCGALVIAGSGSLDTWQRVVSGILFAVGLVFVILLTKKFIDLEGSSRVLSTNLLLFYFQNKLLLKGRGFKVVHYTQLSDFLKEKNKKDWDIFSWNQVYNLSSEPIDTKRSMFWGVKANGFMRKVKDIDH